MPRQSTLFRSADFENIEVFVMAENNTTRTKIENPQQIALLEFKQSGCVLKLPARSCAKGHHMLFKITVLKRFEVEFTAKVLDVQKAEKGFTSVEFEFYQVDQKKWGQLEKLYLDRQSEISRIVRNIKK